MFILDDLYSIQNLELQIILVESFGQKVNIYIYINLQEKILTFHKQNLFTYEL